MVMSILEKQSVRIISHWALILVLGHDHDTDTNSTKTCTVSVCAAIGQRLAVGHFGFATWDVPCFCLCFAMATASCYKRCIFSVPRATPHLSLIQSCC